MKVYFVRHGQAKSNVHPRPDARDPEAGDQLTDLGWGQARALGRRLRDTGITHIITSPMLRAQETAAAIDEELKVPIEVFDEAHEIVHGNDYYDAPAINRLKIFLGYYLLEERGKPLPVEAETTHDTIERVKSLKSYLVEHAPEKNILVVSHGSFLKTFLAHTVEGDDVKPRQVLKYFRLKAINTGISEFEYEPSEEPLFDGWRMVTWMDQSHL